MIIGESIVKEVCVNIGNVTIQNSQEQKILGVLIYTNLSFEFMH